MAESSSCRVYTISSSSSDEDYNKFNSIENESTNSKRQISGHSKLHSLSDSDESLKSLSPLPISIPQLVTVEDSSDIDNQNKKFTDDDSDLESLSNISMLSGISNVVENFSQETNTVKKKKKLISTSCSISVEDNCNLVENDCDVESLPNIPALSNAENFSQELATIKKKKSTRIRNTEKSEKALERLKERERKAQEKILAKALKDFEKEVKQTEKPGMSIKTMKLCIDDRLPEISDSQFLFNILLDAEVSYALERNHIPYSIVWYRHISEMEIVDNQLERKERDVLEDKLLLYIPISLFIDLIYNSVQQRKGHSSSQQSLLEYVSEIQNLFPKMDITVVTVNVQNSLKGKRGNSKQDNEENGRTKNVSKKDLEEVVIEVQLQMFLNYRELSSFTEFGNLLLKYTKAIAEAPIKKEKHSQQQQFSWYAQADSSCPVKISKEGDNYLDLWQQQIQQFNLITKDIAQAIAAKYPSPSLLIEAYSKCNSTKEAEKLLENIVVRRDYGPLGTTRKVGPQLSYKLFRFLTSINANELLQR